MILQAELGLHEMGTPSLLVALDYVELLAEVRPDKFDRASVRWHGRLELESAVLTIAESQLALAVLDAMRASDKDARRGSVLELAADGVGRSGSACTVVDRW